MDACDPLHMTFWDYVDTCRVKGGEQSCAAFVRRTRHYPWVSQPPRPEIDTWPDLLHYVTEFLNEGNLRDAARRTWANYLVHTAAERTAVSHRQLWRLRRQLREAQEAQLCAEETVAHYRDIIATMQAHFRQLADMLDDNETQAEATEQDLAGDR